MKMQHYPHRAVLLACLMALSFLQLASAGTGIPRKPKSGADIIQAMYSRWDKKWYPNFKFEQRAIFYENGAVTKEEVWQEIYSQPGNLHIRFNGFESGSGAVFAADTVYSFKEHQLQAKTFQIHPLVLLAFDVYFYKPEVTVAKLQQLGFDLNSVTEAKWQGRDAYVIGTTNPADSKTSQFWVDKERLYILRVLTNRNGVARDVEMNNYQLIDNKWVATEILFKTDGKLTLREEYFNMSFPETADKSWFDPAKFSSTRW